MAALLNRFVQVPAFRPSAGISSKCRHFVQAPGVSPRAIKAVIRCMLDLALESAVVAVV